MKVEEDHNTFQMELVFWKSVQPFRSYARSKISKVFSDFNLKKLSPDGIQIQSYNLPNVLAYLLLNRACWKDDYGVDNELKAFGFTFYFKPIEWNFHSIYI